MLLLSIRNRADFVAAAKDNTRFYSSTILLLARKTPEKYLPHPRTGEITNLCRVGYTVTKAIGNATQRNKVKRRFRSAFNLLFKNYANNHFDYIILARRNVKGADFKKIYKDLRFCFKGVKRLLKEATKNNNSI